MSIKVNFDEQSRSYVVLEEGQKIDNLPLAYLKGSRLGIGAREIELAYAGAHGYFGGEVAKTKFQRRHEALAKLGLVHDDAAIFEHSCK